VTESCLGKVEQPKGGYAAINIVIHLTFAASAPLAKMSNPPFMLLRFLKLEVGCSWKKILLITQIFGKEHT
jgi:hypothetical protein